MRTGKPVGLDRIHTKQESIKLLIKQSLKIQSDLHYVVKQ